MVLEAKFLVLHYISGIVQEGDIVTNNNNNNNPICKAPECQKTSVALKDFRGATTEANAFYQMVLLSMTFSDP